MRIIIKRGPRVIIQFPQHSILFKLTNTSIIGTVIPVKPLCAVSTSHKQLVTQVQNTQKTFPIKEP